MNGLSIKSLILELRRRRTFRTAGFYIVGAWLVMQAADVFFPAWGLPDAAINVLLATAVLGFPLVLVFGWFYDVTADGIVRTPAAGADGAAAPLPLQRRDYLLRAAAGSPRLCGSSHGFLHHQSRGGSGTARSKPRR